MVEENQVTMNVEETTKGPKEVTTKDLRRVQQGKNLAKWNRKNKKAQKSKVSQYYGIGVVLAVGLIGGLSYYLNQAKVNNVVPPQQPSHPCHQTNKFEME